ncbi:hypothetical protein NIES2109_34020 [Nostoc sp. HK-01]|nr:hypothetical protein NIES2109_34020 [Nostoc sp. HK-01]
MSDVAVPYRSLDWANADLYDGISARPKSSVPLDIPLQLKPKPDGSTPAYSIGEKNLILEEQAAMREYFRQQKAAQEAREAEIFKREQAQRDLLRQRTSPAEPTSSEPRITNRNPVWEEPTPTTKSPTQPLTPSSAKPPPTPNSSAGTRGSSAFEPTVTPAPATFAEPVPPIAPPRSGPSGEPTPAGTGRFAGPAIGAGIDLGMRLASGQPAGQAAFGAVGNFAGALAGTTVGAAFGPAGMFVGGMIGGYIGGAIADQIWYHAFPPAAQTQPEPYTAPPPFAGGQSQGVIYDVTFVGVYKNGSVTSASSGRFYGPIQGTKVDILPFRDSPWNYGKIISAGNAGADGYNPAGGVESIAVFDTDLTGVWITDIKREDGQPDTGGNPPAASSLPPPENRPYVIPSDGNYAPPRAYPGATPGPSNYASPGTAPGGTPRGDAVGWMPHGGLAPGQNPNPTQSPGNLGGELPAATPNNTPGSSPNSIPGWQSAPTGQGQGNVQPVPLGSTGSSSFSIPFIPAIGKANPTPDKNSAAPKNQDPTKPKTPTTPTPTTGGLNKEETQAAVCELTQPTSCLGKPLNRIEDKANQNNNKLDQNSNKLDQLNALLNGLDLAGIAALNSKLDLVNNKLGPQLPGGLATKLVNGFKWLQLDRALNLLTFAATIHNAFMLSNDVGQTLLGALNNVLQVIGLKDDSGQPFDIGSIISSTIENFIKSIVGSENYQAITTVWAKANRIYQATTNVLNAFQGLASTILNALEITAGRVGKIGNALRKAGEVLDNAYSWMNPQPKFNRVTTFLEGLQNGASTIQMVTQIPLDVINATTQLTEANTEFIKALKEDDKPENKGTNDQEPQQLKAELAASKLASLGQEMTEATLEADEDDN